MAVNSNSRRRYYVEPAVQGAMVTHAVCFWLLGSLTFATVIFIYRLAPVWLAGGSLTAAGIWYQMAPMAVSSAVLLPLVTFTAVRFSHRFAGPVVRFRRALGELAEGKAPREISLRKNDFWKDVASDINRVSLKMVELTGDSVEEHEQERELAHCDTAETICR